LFANPFRSTLPGVLAILLLCATAQAVAETPNDMPTAPLQLTTGQGVSHNFKVEVAATSEHRSRGLMFRWRLADDAGMLFIFDRVQHVSMWMRNTFIPLTMLFIRDDGTVARVVDSTRPLSDDSILSGEPVRAVLELAAGSGTRLNLSPGDVVNVTGITAFTSPRTD
jgi:uncharacterized protein